MNSYSYAQRYVIGDFDDQYIQSFVSRRLDEYQRLAEFDGARALFSLDLNLLSVPIRASTLLTLNILN